MRTIIKKGPPPDFEKWKKEFIKEHGKSPEYAYFKGKEKHRLKEYLYNEQYGLCCYCMKEIKDINDCHIEHIKPQCTFENDTMDYNNMLISCNGTKPYASDGETCGHMRKNWYNENYISPLEADAEKHFIFNIDGSVTAPDGDIRSIKTITSLQLNCYSLKRLRRAALFAALDSDDTYDELIYEYSTPVNNKLPEYCVAVLQCINKMK